MKRFLALLLILAFSASGVCLASPVELLPKGAQPTFDEDMELMYLCFFDTLASDSILIMCGGKTMLVDCADMGYGSRVIAPKLRELGITRIDYAVNTHPHDDHINGFISLFDEVEVGGFYTCFPLDYCAEQLACVEAARAHNIAVHTIDNEGDLSFGDVSIWVWQDLKYITPWPIACNPCSLIMHVSYKNSSVILTADAVKESITDLMAEKGDAIKCDIIKMPHHGHNLPSYDAFRLMAPQLAVITNRYSERVHHTVQFMHNNRCPYLFTGDGYVEAWTDGESWQVSQFDKWKPVID